jgi:anti-sigma factor RsiW
MNCDRTAQIHAYHDGELPAGERDSLEAHVKSCAECSELLRELRSLSRMFASAPMVEIPVGAMQHLRQRRYIVPDAGVLKIAGWLTAAAAAVLLAALPMWHQQSNETQAAAPTPELDYVAVTPPADSEQQGRNDYVALAQWMADDLSTSGERRQK